MKEKFNIGFIGYGNMGRAISLGLISFALIDSDRIYACAKNYDKLLKKASEDGIHACKNSSDVCLNSDIIIVAVKPDVIKEVLSPLKEILKNKIVISIAVNCNFDFYENVLEKGTAHCSFLPNTPVKIGEGVIIAEKIHSIKDEDYITIKEIFSKLGLFVEVDTNKIGVAGTVSGCGPAFIAMVIESLSDASVKYGLNRELSYKIVSQMIAGTSKLQLETNDHPAKMKDDVCSPGGTTIKGVSVLEKSGMRSSFIQAIDAILGKNN